MTGVKEITSTGLLPPKSKKNNYLADVTAELIKKFHLGLNQVRSKEPLNGDVFSETS